ncbi:MAG: DUF262 domain-containing protein [Rhodobacteraceae bacterium]|nr:DUF262 domain-containing protein [Paracoccaceae bacterium]
MEIRKEKITVRDLAMGYQDNGEAGVTGHGGRLDIRPPYQREFVYRDEQRAAVIKTLRAGLPLNVMYWADVGNDRFEIIDGQQRTISLCQYVTGTFSFDGLFFHNLQADQQAAILDYPLMVFLCSGTDSARLDWFRTINIAGETLTDQELRNAVYHGPWTADAKRYFSHRNCPAWNMGSAYLKGSAIRQKYLETAIKWINNGDVEGYMAARQHDKSAVALWNHFQAVINWVQATFPEYRREMRGLKWGSLYAAHHKRRDLDPKALEQDIRRLLADDDVTNKKGVWEYVLTGAEKHLNIRAFTDTMKRTVYERQKGICALTGVELPFNAMEADHIIPWSKGGRTELDNCRMISREENRRKSDK